MNRRINFLSILILLSFSIIFSVAIHAQDRLRLSRPAESETNNLSTSSSNTNDSASNDDDSSAFRMSLPTADSHNRSAIKGGVEQETEPGSLTQVQLHKLAAHDIILLIDKSGSMATPDCPISGSSGLKSILPSLILGGSPQNSRWNWCRQQINQMSAQTQQILPAGFTVLLFDSGYHLFPHVTTNNLTNIFAANNPGGSTNLTLPLSQVFNDYFKRQKLSKVKIKPLLVGIITDGCPNDPHAVKKMLVDLTHSLKDANEITIVFFLIGGHDSQGEKFARDLTEKLVSAGAAFDIVKAVPFDQVQKHGLASALADNLE
jgi:Mg-chelatase subunit ChlD